MKKNILLSCVTISLLLFINCSNDDNNNESSGTDVSQNETEESNIDITILENGISIDDASFETGVIETPNEQISFNVEKTEQSGFQDVGFEIELSVPENYAGAYLQFISEDGTASENYYKTSNSASSIITTNESNTSSGKLLADEDGIVIIEVNFDETIPAGSFCYDVWIYDTDGNISASQRLCTEVEEWGGNDTITGTWNFTKVIRTDHTETVTEINLGEDDCDDEMYSTTCIDENGNEFELPVEECYVTINLTLILNSDGTQSLTNINDFKKFENDCDTDYQIVRTNYNASGNWAYDEEEKKLTLVNYEISTVQTIDGEPYDDNYAEETGVGLDLSIINETPTELILEDIFYDTATSNNIITKSYKNIAVYYFSK